MSNDEDKTIHIDDFKEKILKSKAAVSNSGDDLFDGKPVDDAVSFGIEQFNKFMETQGESFVAVAFDENDSPVIIYAGDLDVLTTAGVLDYAKQKFFQELG